MLTNTGFELPPFEVQAYATEVIKIDSKNNREELVRLIEYHLNRLRKLSMDICKRMDDKEMKIIEKI